MNRKLGFFMRAFPLVMTAVVGCSAGTEQAEGCDSTANCPLGQYCLLPERSCIDEQDKTVIGSFDCLLMDKGEKVTNVGRSDVILLSEGLRLTLNAMALCQTSGDKVIINVIPREGTIGPSHYFLVIVPLQNVQEGRSYQLQFEHETELGGFLLDPNDKIIAAASGGTVELSPTQHGQMLHGYIRASVQHR